MKEEIWKDVIGWEDFYKVSSFGRIFSKRKNSYIKLNINKGGYYFFMAKNGLVVKNLVVHRQVALSFLTEPDKELSEKCLTEHHGKVLVNHIDTDKLNNHYLNLEWCDGKQNMQHAHDNGCFNTLSGVNNPLSLIKDQALIDTIRSEHVKYSREFSVKKLAEKYKLNERTVSNIVYNKSYKI